MSTNVRPAGGENFYDTLGVAPTAAEEEIRARYRLLVLETHPDRFADPTDKARAAEHFKQVRRAFEVLGDPDERRRFDASQRAGRTFVPAHQGGSDDIRSLKDIFAEFERFGFPSGSQLIATSRDNRTTAFFDQILIRTPDYEERLIHIYSPLLLDVMGLPVAAIRGTAPHVAAIWLTNLAMIFEFVSETREVSYPSSMAKYLWWDVRRMVLELRPGIGFAATFFGPTLPISSVKFEFDASPFPLLWIAEVHGIEVEVVYTTPASRVAHIGGFVLALALTLVPMVMCAQLAMAQSATDAFLYYSLACGWFLLFGGYALRRAVREVPAGAFIDNLQRGGGSAEGP